MFGAIITLLIGVGLGYFFKPQLDRLVGKAVRMIRDRTSGDDKS